MEEVDKEAKEEDDKSRAKKTKNNNNDMKKTNKDKNSNTSGNHCLCRTNPRCSCHGKQIWAFLSGKINFG